MALINDYHLFLELQDKQGKVQHQFGLETLTNCFEDFKFSAFCQGLLENDGLDPACHLEPVWEHEGETPYCSGFRLCLSNGEVTYEKAYSKSVFRYQVFRVVRELLQKNQLKEGMGLNYRLAIFPKNDISRLDNRGQNENLTMSIESIRQPIPIVETSLKPYLRQGRADSAEVEMGVWIAQHVIDEMIEYVLQNKEKERAGFLIGHLCQDRETKKLFLICPAQVIARFQDKETFGSENRSSLTHFQFSPETFFEVQRVIELRKQNEIVLGWYHSHPWPFACPKGDKCECTSVFFSPADFEVMEAAFGAPYQVAIVIGRASLKEMKATPQMYGWKDGLITPRDFLRFDATDNKQIMQS